MQANRGRDTSSEVKVRRELFRRGMRCRVGVAPLPGVHILSGVHGFPDGTTKAALRFFTEDRLAFRKIEEVTVYNMPEMPDEAIQVVLELPGTIIGGFCDSLAYLKPLLKSNI